MPVAAEVFTTSTGIDADVTVVADTWGLAEHPARRATKANARPVATMRWRLGGEMRSVVDEGFNVACRFVGMSSAQNEKYFSIAVSWATVIDLVSAVRNAVTVAYGRPFLIMSITAVVTPGTFISSASVAVLALIFTMGVVVPAAVVAGFAFAVVGAAPTVVTVATAFVVLGPGSVVATFGANVVALVLVELPQAARLPTVVRATTPRRPRRIVK